MKKISYFIMFAVIFSLPVFSFAHGVTGSDIVNTESVTAGQVNGHTKEAEEKGELIQKNIQGGTVRCEDLSNEDFEVLGMYFMGLMTGESHGAMDEMMESAMGEEGEIQMHVAMGKRLSDCDTSAQMPSSGMGFTNMMSGGMMGGGGTMMSGFGTSAGWFGLGWIFMILFWALVIAGAVFLIKWLAIQGKGDTKDKTSLDILKERYAKGEIDKQEFEEKKKDLV